MNETGLKGFESERESFLSLPIKKKDLGNFVADLLGQQQTIERVFEESFDFDFDWFINLHELIDQRINQQTHSNLVSFTFIVYFGGGLKRTVTSIESLKGYTETKKEIPFGVKIVWNYLVHFPGKDYPEKQVVSFSAFRQKNKKIEFSGLSINGILLKRYSVKSERSSVRVQIDHTERTWGDDLEVIISNQIDEGLRKNGSGNLLYNLFRATLALAIMLGGLIYGFISSLTSKMDQVKDAMTKYEGLGNIIGQDLISEKLDIIAKITEISATRDENIGLFLLYFFGAALLSTVLLEITKRESHSFLVFSTSSEEYRMKMLKKEKKGLYILLGSFIFSVVASIIANFGYELIG